MSLAVMLDWVFNQAIFRHFNPSFVFMPFHEALAFFLCGSVALAGQVVERRYYWGGLMASLLGILSLLEYGLTTNLGIDDLFVQIQIFAQTAHHRPTSPVTSLIILLGGLGIASMSQGLPKVSLKIIGILGVLIATLGIGNIFGFLWGMDVWYGFHVTTHPTLQTGITACFLGAGIFVQACQREFDQHNRFPSWFIPAAGIIGFGVVFSVFQVFLTKEQRLIHEFMMEHVRILEQEINRSFEYHYAAQDRFGSRWAILNGKPRSLFDADAAHYFRDQNALLYMGIINRSGLIEWEKQNSIFSDKSIMKNFSHTLLQEDSVFVRGHQTQRILTQGFGNIPIVFSFLIPQKEGGHLASIYDWRKLLHPIVEKTFGEGFALLISKVEDGEVIYQNEQETHSKIEKWRIRKIIEVNGKPLELEISPTQRFVTAQFGNESIIILLVGMLLLGIILWNLKTTLNLYRKSCQLVDTTKNLDREIIIREEVQGQLKETTRFNELLLTSAGEGIYGLDSNGTTTFVNPAAARMLGYEVEELIGQPMHEMVHHSYLDGSPYPKTQCHMYAAIREKITYRIEDEMLWRKDGIGIPVAYTSTPLIEKGGSCQGAVIVFQDISERKQKDAQIQAFIDTNKNQIRQLRLLANLARQLNFPQSLPDMMQLITDEVRGIIGAHQATVSFTIDKQWAQAITGLSLSEKYANYRNYAVPPDGSGIYSLICETNKPLRMTQDEIEAHVRWRGFGKEAPNHPPMRGWLAVPLIGQNGHNLGLIQLSDKFEGDFTESDEAMLTQVAQLASAAIELQRWHENLEHTVLERTEHLKRVNADLEKEALRRKQYEQEILYKNRDLETLLYIISHDLKEPLRSIQNFSQMVVDTCRTQLDAKGLDYLERVIRGGERLTQLLSDVQQVAQVQTVKPPNEQIDIKLLVDKALQRLSDEIRRVKAVIRLDSNFPSVPVDALWGTQAIFNLINNALKFQKDNERPQIDIIPFWGNANFPDELGLVVSDRGTGVPPKDRERIFQLFRRAVHRNIPGTGTGLAIVQQVAERHGGHAWVENREGGGSSFFLTFATKLVNHTEEERYAKV